ncbi:uracil-DNA glycosylase [Candidatus Parcubacteria bacterium]|nr:uracil-DNA glycosylase [Candidatus Parcubacteria bacterium]
MDKTAALRQVAERIATDGVCPQLRVGATQLVPGEGGSDAAVMFIGEAPGAHEDKQGKPFVGAAGKFLNEMLAGIGLDRQNVYITNIVKYRPPANRDPLPEEIKAFMPYLQQQINIIKPKLIVFLGRHAMNVFLPELKISQAHGRALRKNGQVYLPLFHPAAALYNGGMRQTLIDDFNRIPLILQKIADEPNPEQKQLFK